MPAIHPIVIDPLLSLDPVTLEVVPAVNQFGGLEVQVENIGLLGQDDSVIVKEGRFGCTRLEV
jgi:hypothetical protein